MLSYFIALGIFIALDFLWIGVIAKKLYRKELGQLLKDKYEVIGGGLIDNV